MFSKQTFSILILLTVLGYQNSSIFADIIHPDYVRIFGHFSTVNNSGQDSKSKEHMELESELDALIQEMKKLEDDVREKMRKEILPLIRHEVEKLRKRLREFHIEGDNPEPRKINILNQLKNNDAGYLRSHIQPYIEIRRMYGKKI